MTAWQWGLLVGLGVGLIYIAVDIGVILIRHRFALAKITAEHEGWRRGYDEAAELYRKLNEIRRA